MKDLLANGIFPQPLTARKCECLSPDIASGSEHGIDVSQTLVSAAEHDDACPLSLNPRCSLLFVLDCFTTTHLSHLQ
jgi:hypothetical protein